MKPILAFFLPAVSSMLMAQTPVWYHQIGPTGGSATQVGLEQGATGTLYAFGKFSGTVFIGPNDQLAEENGDVFLAKMNANGEVLWTRTAGGNCQYSGESAVTSHHDPILDRIYLTGQISCTTNDFGGQAVLGPGGINEHWPYVAAYEGDGECAWATSITSTTASFPNFLADNNGTLFMFGSTGPSTASINGASIPESSGYIARVQPNGDLISLTQAVTNGRLVKSAWVDNDTWLLAGRFEQNASLYGQPADAFSNSQEAFVAMIDTNGTVHWKRQFPASIASNLWNVFFTTDDRIIVSGSFDGDLYLPEDTLSVPGPSRKLFVASLTMTGEVEWAFPIVTGSINPIMEITLDPSGHAYIYGSYTNNLLIAGLEEAPLYTRTGFCAKISAQGTCAALWLMAPIELQYAIGMALPTDQGLYMSIPFSSTMTLGSTTIEHSGNPTYDYLVARFDSLSGFTNVPTAMAPEGGGLVIYANPNEGRCTVELPKGIAPGSVLRLVVRDAQGQLVQEEPFILSASGTVQLDISAQARGVYHVELLDERRRYTGKVVFE